MKKITQIAAISVFSVFGLFSCAKPGCTDDKATNYNAEAKDDDGTCTYRGDIAFWCLPDVSTALKDAGHTMLRFELEGQIVDSIETQYFFSPSGECNTPGVKTLPREDLPYEFRHYKYRVKGAGFATLYEGFITLDANECLSIKLD